MQIKKFRCREEVEEFFNALSYDELWETIDGYGELSEIKATWDKERADGISKTNDVHLLRLMACSDYLSANPNLPRRYQIDIEDKYGIPYHEYHHKLWHDPLSLIPVLEEAAQNETKRIDH